MYLNLNIIPLGLQKVKNIPKISSKSKVRIKGRKESKSCASIWVDPKTVFKPHRNFKNGHFEPKKQR